MHNRVNAVPMRAAGTVATWRLREAGAGSRILDCLLSWYRGALPATVRPTMGEMILFGEGASDLDGGARAALRDRSAVLRANPGIRVVIGGFTSRSDFTAYAMGLALHRVLAIRAFLLSQGVDRARIEVAIRGAGWSLLEQPRGAAEPDSSGQCRLHIVDPRWAPSRN